MDSIIISASVVATIITVTQVLKKLLESKLFAWLLSLLKLGAIVPYLGVILSVVVGILAGLTAYGADGLTIAEIVQMIMDIIAANGAFMLVAKASGVEPAPKKKEKK